VRSAHPPERLAVELQSRVGAVLSQSGYRVVAHGPSGIAWRRDLSGKVIAGLVILGLLALGGVASGEAGSIVFGLVCAVGAGALAYSRRPAGVTIGLVRISGGTEVSVSGGPDTPRAKKIAMVVAGPAPDARAAGSGRSPDGLDGQDQLAVPIARLVREAQARSARIGAAIERSELPYEDVRAEVEGFVVAIGRAAQRAQLLYDALEDTPRARVAERLEEVRDDRERTDLAAALARQLQTLERMERQLERFYTELERLLVELDTVRSELVSVSASSEVAEQQRLADEVRALRECMVAVAEAVADSSAR
jgi:hypothetical protein